MKKNLLLLFLLFSLCWMPIVHAQTDTSFHCEYKVNDDNSLRADINSGTLSCEMGYHYGAIIEKEKVSCKWTTSNGSYAWAEKSGAGDFNLKEYLKTGTTSCPKYVSVQTSNDFYVFNKKFRDTDTIQVYFSNNLREVQSISGKYQAVGSEINLEENELKNQKCNARDKKYFEQLFQQFDKEIQSFQKNGCDTFSLSSSEQQGVASVESMNQYNTCKSIFSYSDGALTTLMQELRNLQTEYQCFPDTDYRDILTKFHSYQTTIKELRENLEKGFQKDPKPEDPDNPDDPDIDPDDPNKPSKDPDYHVTDTNVNQVCSSPSYRKPMKFLGTIVTFIKIIVPIVIIGFGVFDLYKGITASKEEGLKKAVRSLIIRVIAGIFIFLLPGLIQYVLSMVNEWSDYKNTWCCCTDCLLNSDCDTNSCSSSSCHIEGTN